MERCMPAGCSSSSAPCCRAAEAPRRAMCRSRTCRALAVDRDRATSSAAEHSGAFLASRSRSNCSFSSQNRQRLAPLRRSRSQNVMRRSGPPGVGGCETTDDDARWDVVGLGQAMIDFVAEVDEEYLQRLDIEKGSRRLIDVEERGRLISGLNGGSYTVTAGGSMANSLVALSKLGAAHAAGVSGIGCTGGLRVAMAGPVGADPLGSFFVSQMQQAGVSMLTQAPPSSNTGTVVVLTTPDAQRSFLSYLGSADQVLERPSSAAAGQEEGSGRLAAALRRTRLLLVEGYLWELPGSASAIREAVAAARQGGAMVALTCGAAGVVRRHASDFLGLAAAGDVDVLFANREEAQELLQAADAAAAHTNAPSSVNTTAQAKAEAPLPTSPPPADECALRLGSAIPLSVVTDGANGAAVSAHGRLHVVPPCWRREPPRDTNGAGDAWAAGFLYGLLSGADVSAAGWVGARVASEVISRPGAGLTYAEAQAVLVAEPDTAAGDKAGLFPWSNGAQQQQQAGEATA